MNEKAEVKCDKSGVFVTEEQLKKIKGEFWNVASVRKTKLKKRMVSAI